jgi:hypothetical protein
MIIIITIMTTRTIIVMAMIIRMAISTDA